MNDDTPVVIGLDVGTSSVKAAAFGGAGQRGDVARRAVSTRSEPGGHSTQDPGELRGAVLGALTAAVATAPRRPDAVALCTAMHAVVGLDAHDTPVTRLLTWADGRAAGIVDRWATDGSAGFVHDRTGVPVHAMAPLAKLAWFAETEPDVADRVACWVDLKALVAMWLTGDAVTEISSASGWGLMNIRTHTWDPDALELAGVAADRLPVIEAPTAMRKLGASVADQVGVAAGIPVVLGAADGPLGNVGVGATRPGVAGVSVGTSAAVRVVVDEVPPVAPGLFCYTLTEDRWVLGGAVSNGGNVVGWLAATLLEGPGDHDEHGASAQVAAVMDLAAAAPAGADGLVMVPYLVAERAPLWDGTIPGAYLGLQQRHTRAHLARAAIEGVCAGLGVIADRIATVTPVTSVHATGGTMAASIWRQSLAAAMARPTVVMSAEAGSALGAAVMGLVALGAAEDLDTARRLLVGPDAPEPEPVDVSGEAAEAAVQTRRRIAALGAQMTRIADAFEP